MILEAVLVALVVKLFVCVPVSVVPCSIPRSGTPTGQLKLGSNIRLSILTIDSRTTENSQRAVTGMCADLAHYSIISRRCLSHFCFNYSREIDGEAFRPEQRILKVRKEL